MKTLMYCWKQGSKGGKDLAASLDIKRISHNNSKFTGGKDYTVINWGSSNPPYSVVQSNVLNHPEAIGNASNKLKAFKLMKAGGVRVPNFTTDPNVAAILLNEGHTVVVRHKLQGHSGEGIEIINGGNKLPDAPLYVQYVPKHQEYRVHVLGDKIICTQRKARKNDVPDEQVDWNVRNLKGGFIFARNDGHVVKDQGLKEAVLTIEALGLDFGAVDLIYNEKMDKYFVLEVNTAPGLVGTTLEDYTKAFKEFLHNLEN